MKCNVKTCKAECCGPVPVPVGYLDIFKDRIDSRSIVVDTGSPFTRVVMRTDGVCGFLDKDFHCSIYENRPEICRMFGSGKTEYPLLKCVYLGQISREDSEKTVDEKMKSIGVEL